MKLSPTIKKNWHLSFILFFPPTCWEKCIFFSQIGRFSAQKQPGFSKISNKKDSWRFFLFLFPPTRYKNLCWNPLPIEYTENGLTDLDSRCFFTHQVSIELKHFFSKFLIVPRIWFRCLGLEHCWRMSGCLEGWGWSSQGESLILEVSGKKHSFLISINFITKGLWRHYKNEKLVS